MVSIGEYTLCQKTCNDDHMSCINNADVYFESVDAGFELLSDLVNCNGRLARCVYACHSEHLGTGAAMLLTSIPGILVGVVFRAAFRGLGYGQLQAIASGVAVGVMYVALGFYVPSQSPSTYSRKRVSLMKLKPQESRNSRNNVMQGGEFDVQFQTSADIYNSSRHSFEATKLSKSSTLKNSAI